MLQIWYLCSAKFSIADIGTKVGRNSPGTTKSTNASRVRGHTLTTSLLLHFFTPCPPFSSLKIQIHQTPLRWGWLWPVWSWEKLGYYIFQQRTPVRFLNLPSNLWGWGNIYTLLIDWLDGESFRREASFHGGITVLCNRWCSGLILAPLPCILFPSWREESLEQNVCYMILLHSEHTVVFLGPRCLSLGMSRSKKKKRERMGKSFLA